MVDRLLGDAVVVLHLAFIAFAMGGGMLVIAWPRVAWLHLPAVIWAAYVEFTSTICPLTPLENALRLDAGRSGYEGGFIEHYVLPIVYPVGLTPYVQTILGVIVISAVVGALAGSIATIVVAPRLLKVTPTGNTLVAPLAPINGVVSVADTKHWTSPATQPATR